MPGAEHAGIERLAGRDEAAQCRQRARPRPVGDHAVLGRRHAQHGDVLAGEQLEPLVRVEASVVQQRRRAAQPRRDERVAGGLRPARRRGAPHELAGTGVEPVLGLRPLAGQVALPVEHGLGLARGAGRERDQARVVRCELRRRRSVAGGPFAPRAPDRRPVPAGLAQHAGVALVGHDDPRSHGLEARSQVLRAQLLGAGQHDVALVEAGDHGEHPFGLVPEQREHHIAAPEFALRQVRGERPRRVRDLTHRPFPPHTGGIHGHERTL